ncbi:MAG: Maf family protein [Candidatus Xenobia bacterium]
MREVILASSSPRRRMLLTQVGVRFQVIPPELDEDHELARGLQKYRGDPRRSVRSLAAAKVRAVVERLPPGNRIIIAADTTVVLDGTILNKPIDEKDACRMLGMLAGRTHRVITGIAVAYQPEGRIDAGSSVTAVTFRRLTPQQIKAYVATGEPMDKAGSYGVQEKGALLVSAIHGDYFNVVGLPLSLLQRLLQRRGIDLLESGQDTSAPA